MAKDIPGTPEESNKPKSTRPISDPEIIHNPDTDPAPTPLTLSHEPTDGAEKPTTNGQTSADSKPPEKKPDTKPAAAGGGRTPPPIPPTGKSENSHPDDEEKKSAARVRTDAEDATKQPLVSTEAARKKTADDLAIANEKIARMQNIMLWGCGLFAIIVVVLLICWFFFSETTPSTPKKTDSTTKNSSLWNSLFGEAKPATDLMNGMHPHILQNLAKLTEWRDQIKTARRLKADLDVLNAQLKASSYNPNMLTQMSELAKENEAAQKVSEDATTEVRLAFHDTVTDALALLNPRIAELEYEQGTPEVRAKIDDARNSGKIAAAQEKANEIAAKKLADANLIANHETRIVGLETSDVTKTQLIADLQNKDLVHDTGIKEAKQAAQASNDKADAVNKRVTIVETELSVRMKKLEDEIVLMKKSIKDIPLPLSNCALRDKIVEEIKNQFPDKELQRQKLEKVYKMFETQSNACRNAGWRLCTDRNGCQYWAQN